MLRENENDGDKFNTILSKNWNTKQSLHVLENPYSQEAD